MRERGADVAAAVAVADGHVVLGPVARERLDGVVGHLALGLRPFRRLGNAVVQVAQNVLLEPVEAVGVRGDVVLVVQGLGYPHNGDGELQGGVGVRQDRNPLVGVDGARIVHVGADEDRLDPDVVEPEAHAAGLLAAPPKRRRFGIGTPEQHGVAVFSDVLEHIALPALLADGIHAPDVLGAPVPALPAVGLAALRGAAAYEVEHGNLAAVASGDVLRFAVPFALAVDGERAVGFLDALDLLRNEVGGLVPADALVLRRPARFGVPVSVRIPIDALQGIGHAVLRIGALLVGKRERADERLHARLEHVPVFFQRPVVEIFLGVLLVVVKRPDAHDLAVQNIDVRRVRADAAAAKAQIG